MSVAGKDGGGSTVGYKVAALLSEWTPVDAGISPNTPRPPPHGDHVWRAELKPAAAGGALTITVSNGAVNGTATITRVTHGDVWFCSGQSNMALETYYTFSANSLKAEIAAGKYHNLHHFMMGGMGDHYEATTPQWATSQNSVSAGQPGQDPFVWHQAPVSAALPSLDNTTKRHSPWAQFAATCMYFGAELIKAREAKGVDADVPVGLIQSAIGGSQIESWMDNETLTVCKNESLSGGAVPQDSGALYYGMVAPFANYSVAGWVWYQGENNVYGDMGNSITKTGYGCELPTMVNFWRSIWRAPADALFGVATLAAGGSEGNGQHMAGMRWSETANYGVLPNQAMPHSFLAQVYDLGDPWAAKEKGWSGGDPYNCSLPDPATGKYGPNCTKWDPETWSAGMQPYATLIRANDPSGLPGINFMGGIHPRLKRPVGHRLAVAAVALLHPADPTAPVPLTGPTIAGCSHAEAGQASTLTLKFDTKLLGDDDVQVRPFETNMSLWAGVDSLTAMVCASAPPPPPLPGGETCQKKCEAAGHCSVGLTSCDQLPSCGQGCMVAEAGATLEVCRSVCLKAGTPGCTHQYKNLTLQSCEECATWGPNQTKPAGISPSADCGSNTVGHCYEGCAYAHGAPPKPIFPAANATVCACQSWNKVACDGGEKGQSNKWPCTIDRPGSVYWYCEDGPGWKPPRALRDRAALEERDAEAARRARINYKTGEGAAVGVPRLSDNIFEMLWTAVPVAKGAAKGTVELDLTVLGERTNVHSVRYAWPLGGDGDTCCPGADVDAGFTVCAPANCPILSESSQLPANPFFATITNGKCSCEAPTVCDA